METARAGWRVAQALCTNCGFWSVAVFPETGDPSALECGECGEMASQALCYLHPEDLFNSRQT